MAINQKPSDGPASGTLCFVRLLKNKKGAKGDGLSSINILVDKETETGQPNKKEILFPINKIWKNLSNILQKDFTCTKINLQNSIKKDDRYC